VPGTTYRAIEEAWQVFPKPPDAVKVGWGYAPYRGRS
jgi:hypothetical protein